MNIDMDRMKKQICFIEHLDRLKQVIRQNLLMNESRRENSAEHSWHIATMAMVLAEYAPHELDQLRVLKMLLVHDVIEIEAGDTFCYDVEGNKGKEERERLAADQVFGLLPSDLAADFRAIWDEFEQGDTPEARFANALDRFQVLLQNFNTGGGTWRIHNIEKKQVIQRMLPIKTGAPSLWPVVESCLEEACDQGMLKDTVASQE
ncbi:hydrolase [Desulfuromonas versatilis]|uniref:Hydrolase n=1 Tax=Desulfuromonas versatilis TaxID=2802975 RepID=A0ABM8HRH4_9BACT|nr:HD domain-containing protein [Desulfuromonas versatilis]BCR04880.1 hydrolase [Desulfuromonas versatilis]